MKRYKCLECGDLFIHPTVCGAHNLEKGHEKFEIVDTDVSFYVKSDEAARKHIVSFKNAGRFVF